MMTFNCGVPTGEAPVHVEGYGLAQFRFHYENGDILLYMGGNRMFAVSGKTRWRYV
jgi:hypothetical protein